MIPQSPKWFRRAIIAFAAMVGVFATWTVLAELLRRPQATFPATAEAARSLLADRRAATLAAQLAMLRGDLWTECAITYLDLLWGESPTAIDVDVSAAMALGNAAAERAVIKAPHDARAWLILAGLNTRLGWLNDSATSWLKMSYYTGTNEVALMPLRLLVSVRSNALADEDIRALVRHEIQLIVIRKPDLKSAIIAAHRDALPEGRQFIETTLAEFDPKLLASIRSSP